MRDGDAAARAGLADPAPRRCPHASSVRRISPAMFVDQPPLSGPSPCACAQPSPERPIAVRVRPATPERPVTVRVRREFSAEVPDRCSLAPALAPEEHFWADEAVGGRRVPAAVTGSPEIARGAALPTGVPQASSRRDAGEESVAGAVPPPPVLARCRVRRLGLVTHRGERPGSAALGFPSVRPSLFWLEQIRRGSQPHILSRNERRLRPGDENAPWMLPWVGVDHVTPSEPGGHSLSFRDDRKRRAPVFRFILSGGFYLGQVSLELPVHQWAGEAGSIGCRGGSNQALGHPSAPTGSHRRPSPPPHALGSPGQQGTRSEARDHPFRTVCLSDSRSSWASKGRGDSEARRGAGPPSSHASGRLDAGPQGTLQV